MTGFIRIPKLNFKTYEPEGDATIGTRWIVWIQPFSLSFATGCEVLTSQGVILTSLSFEQVNNLIVGATQWASQVDS